MTTEINMNLTKEESIALNELWFECFGEFTTIDSMDKIETYISSKESANEMAISTNNGNVKISLNIEANNFFKILAGIEIVTYYMPSENVPSENIRQVIRSFHEAFGKEPEYKLRINNIWMCKNNNLSEYEEGDEYREIYNYYTRCLEIEGYDSEYINENLSDYVSCHIYGSKLFMKAKKNSMLGEVLGENLNPIHSEIACEELED